MGTEIATNGTHEPARPTFLARWSVDGVFGAVAFALGVPSLAYPFGRDQGLFYYAAREWLLRGQVLYRDVWDHKPPVIYLLHMLALSLFGEHLWGIRVLELCIAIPALGFLAARAATPRGERVLPGTFGAAWLVASVVYYGSFDYWDTAQCEVWCALFSLAAIVCVLRVKTVPHAYFWGGLFSAIALFTKPPSLTYVVVAIAAMLVRAWREADRRRSIRQALAAYAAGGLVFTVPLLAYLAAKHALGPMIDIVVGANGTYLARERNVTELYEVFTRTTDAVRLFQPWSGIVLGAFSLTVLVGRARGDRTLIRRYALPFTLVVCAWLTTLMQLKFYHYHWGTIVAGFATMGGALWRDLGKLVDEGAFSAGARRWLRAPFFFVAVALLFTCDSKDAEFFYLETRTIAQLEQHRITREQFTFFNDKPGFYSLHDAELVGSWLRAASSPDDTVAVRGFEPEIYAFSGRHYTGRFYWTPFLTGAGRVYRREELVAEDRAELLRRPPRYVVVLAHPLAALDSADYFRPLGYGERFSTPSLVVLEKS